MNGLGVARRWAGFGLAVVVVALALTALPALAQEAAKEPTYRSFPLIGSRLAVWAVAQLHLNFAAFILGCPIFAVIIEIIGWRTRDEKYDWLAHEFVKLTFAAFSTTALLGAFLLFLFVGYYPKFWTYMTSIFFPTYWVYALLFFAFGSAGNAGLVLVNVPFSLVGGIIALKLRNINLSVSAAVGFISLFGVSAMDGILLVSYIRRAIEEGMGTEEAIIRAAQTRMRQIFMTGLSACIGLLPAAIP